MSGAYLRGISKEQRVLVVVRTTQDMLRLVPHPLREAATAIGLPRAYVIRHISYHAAKADIDSQDRRFDR